MTLNTLVPGEEAVVTDLFAEGALGQRLMDLGFYSGASVRVIRVAPFFDPVEIELDGYHVCLRHKEAELVAVVKK